MGDVNLPYSSLVTVGTIPRNRTGAIRTFLPEYGRLHHLVAADVERDVVHGARAVVVGPEQHVARPAVLPAAPAGRTRPGSRCSAGAPSRPRRRRRSSGRSSRSRSCRSRRSCRRRRRRGCPASGRARCRRPRRRHAELRERPFEHDLHLVAHPGGVDARRGERVLDHRRHGPGARALSPAVAASRSRTSRAVSRADAASSNASARSRWAARSGSASSSSRSRTRRRRARRSARAAGPAGSRCPCGRG